MDSDPYLETCEKKDAFLLRMLEIIRAGLSESASVNAMDALFRLLEGNQPHPIQIKKGPQEDWQEADGGAALNFVEIF